MKKYGKKQKKLTANKLLDIESKDRLSSEHIDELSNKPQLLDIYLKSSIENTFSELLFRLTYAIAQRFLQFCARTLLSQNAIS